MFGVFQLFLWLHIGSVICYFETYFIEPEINRNGRNAINLEQYKWPNGTVHFVFDYSYNANDRNAILTAMDLIVEKTCVKFVMKAPSQKEHIRFTKVIATIIFKDTFSVKSGNKKISSVLKVSKWRMRFEYRVSSQSHRAIRCNFY